MRQRRAWSFVMMCVLVSACGSAGLSDGVCAGDDPAEGCGEGCATDTDCAPGLYCGADLVCTADCTAGGGECADGQSCDAHGRCVADGSDVDAGADADCPSAEVALAPLLPAVYFLIDRSGSMTEDFDDTDRWSGVAAALSGPTGVVPALQDRVIFGAALYDGTEDTCPALVPVTAALDNFQPIADLMADHDPRGDTPTGESILALMAAIGASPPPADSPKIIIVATDGEPDTCAVPNPQTGQPEAVAAAQDAFDAGFLLYMLSVGSGPGSPSEEHLQDMANAGVGLPVDGATSAPFFVANDTDTLISQLTTLINGARTCEIAVDGNVDLGRAGEGTVVLNGVTLGYGTEWTMQDEGTILLLGDACDLFLATPDVELTASFPCGVVVP